MELLSMLPPVYAALQAVTLTQVAVGALVTLVAAAALFAFVRYMQSEVEPLSASDASSSRSSGANTPDDFFSQRAHGAYPPLGSSIWRAAANFSGEGWVRSEEHQPQVDKFLSEKFEEICRKDPQDQERLCYIHELVDWLDMPSSFEWLNADVAKSRFRIEDQLKKLVGEDVGALLQALKIEPSEEGSREVLRVRADGNCAYYAIASALILLESVPEGFSDNFIELSRELRAYASRVSKECSNQVLEPQNKAWLDMGVQGWVDSLLKQYLNEALCSDDAMAVELAVNGAVRSLHLSVGERARFTAALRGAMNREDRGSHLVTAGFSDADIELVIGDDHARYCSRYIEQIEHDGFFASPFELSLLSSQLKFPLKICIPSMGGATVEFNTEGLPEGASSIEITWNGKDHFDMIMPRTQ